MINVVAGFVCVPLTFVIFLVFLSFCDVFLAVDIRKQKLTHLNRKSQGKVGS